jgi:hypothetical protein
MKHSIVRFRKTSQAEQPIQAGVNGSCRHS